MTRRVSQEPAWILHRRPYRDTSFLLDVLTPKHGRLALIARGGRQSKTSAALQAHQFLHIDFVMRGELGSLGKFETVGPALNLRGISLWSAFYVNELVVRLVSSIDTGSEHLFQLYDDTLRRLVHEPPALVLRGFEYGLLAALGYALDAQVISSEQNYYWDEQRGLRSAPDGVSGAAIVALIEGARDTSILPTQDLLAVMLQGLLGAKPLQTSVVLREMVGLRRAQRERYALGQASVKSADTHINP